MSPKPNVSAQRTRQIIAAATTVFAGKGFAGSTMADIAAEAGINKATIYLYFDSKDALIQAISEQLFTQELADLQAAHAMQGTATERLAAYFEALIAGETEVSPLLPVIYDFYALGLRREDVRVVLAEYMAKSAVLLQTIIEEGVATGEFAPVDAPRAAWTFSALLDGIILQGAYVEALEIKARLRFSVQFLLKSLITHGEEIP